MTDDEHIEQLRTAPLVIPLTNGERRWAVVQKLCAVISILSLAVAAGGIVLVFNLAICTNTNLGTRQAPANRDTQAHIDYAVAQQELSNANKPIRDALAAAIRAERTGDMQAQKAAATAFVIAFLAAGPAADRAATQTNEYVKTLEADKAARTAHPLGKC